MKRTSHNTISEQKSTDDESISSQFALKALQREFG